jgi:2-dehydropantoate 2-reductase
MKISVVGVGAMGTLYAALLRRAGHEVWAIDPWQEHVGAIERDGLRVSGASGDRVVTGIQAADVEQVTRRIAPLLDPDDVVMPFQNGLGAGERVARHVPEEQVVIGIAEGFGSSIPEPGHVHHNGMRLIRIGEMHGGLTSRATGLEEMWRDAGFPARAFADIDLMVWEKFLCNVTLSAPTAAFDMTVGELMADEQAWAVAIAAMLEAHAVALAVGIEFGFDDPVAYVTEFATTIPDASPSMRLDHLARRPSEIDVINGRVVDLGRELGIATPVNQTLAALLRAREARFGPPA